MLMNMREMMKRKDGQKGFTLVELIVVMAILAVLAGIAVPKYNGIQNLAKLKADGSSAMAIIHAARLQHGVTGDAVDGLPSDTEIDNPLSTDYIEVDIPQSGDDYFVLSYNSADDVYSVSWTPTAAKASTTTEQTVAENTMSGWEPAE